jgi:nitrile hydratase accessory protein
VTQFDLTGQAAPPMANGELAFEAPWQGRAFGMATALAAAGVFSWDEFRAELIARIAAWEERAPEGTDYPYYDCFLEALERLLEVRGVLPAADLSARRASFEGRRPGHDHPHGHDRSH